MTGFTSRRLQAYAALGAAGLVAGLALGRVEPVALAAPFLLALVAAVAEREPEVSVRASIDPERRWWSTAWKLAKRSCAGPSWSSPSGAPRSRRIARHGQKGGASPS